MTYRHSEDAASRAGSRFQRGQVPHGVAVMLPLLFEDHMKARKGGLWALGGPRVLTRLHQIIRCHGGKEVAPHRNAAGSDLEDLCVARWHFGEDRHVQA